MQNGNPRPVHTKSVRSRVDGKEPPLALRQEKQYLYFGDLFPVRQGLFPCNTALLLKNSHRASPVLQEFVLVLRPGVWHSTSCSPSPALGLRVVAYLLTRCVTWRSLSFVRENLKFAAVRCCFAPPSVRNLQGRF